MRHIEIYDTTLRDGAQSEGINYSVSDKLKIIKKLDKLGVHYIEAGWPGANPVDNEVFDQIDYNSLKHAQITAFGCTRKPNTEEADDNVLKNACEFKSKNYYNFWKIMGFSGDRGPEHNS